MKLNNFLYIFPLLLISCSNTKENNSIVKQHIDTKYVCKDSIYNMSEVDKYPQYVTKEKEHILEFFLKEFQKPEQELLQTRVVLEFVVDTLGIINDIQIYNKETKDYTLMDLEAIRVLRLSSSKWKCGYVSNKKVSVRMILPIHIDSRE